MGRDRRRRTRDRLRGQARDAGPDEQPVADDHAARRVRGPVSDRLAHYLAIKDVGRDPAEAQELDTIYQTRLKSMLDALDHREGEARRRFLAPYIVPGGSE